MEIIAMPSRTPRGETALHRVRRRVHQPRSWTPREVAVRKINRKAPKEEALTVLRQKIRCLRQENVLEMITKREVRTSFRRVLQAGTAGKKKKLDHKTLVEEEE